MWFVVITTLVFSTTGNATMATHAIRDINLRATCEATAREHTYNREWNWEGVRFVIQSKAVCRADGQPLAVPPPVPGYPGRW